MKRALNEYVILGLNTTIPFHKAILKNKNFVEGDLHTHFIDEHKKGIEKEMENVIIEDLERVSRLKSTFMPAKKIAAISSAVGSYLTNTKTQKIHKNRR